MLRLPSIGVISGHLMTPGGFLSIWLGKRSISSVIARSGINRLICLLPVRMKKIACEKIRESWIFGTTFLLLLWDCIKLMPVYYGLFNTDLVGINLNCNVANLVNGVLPVWFIGILGQMVCNLAEIGSWCRKWSIEQLPYPCARLINIQRCVD